MKLIIDIPEEYYNLLKGFDEEKCSMDMFLLKNGTPLDTHDEEIIATTVESIWGKPPYTDMLDNLKAEITNYLQIMDICDVKKVNGVIIQSESVGRKVVLYDSVMQIIDKYRNEVSECG